MVILWDGLPPASEEAPLYGASACEFADSIYVLGGWSQDPGAPAHEIRHCVFDMNTQTWLPQEALDIDGEVPSPRAGCSVTRIRGSIYLFGGQQLWPSEYLDDFYVGSILQNGVVSWNGLHNSLVSGNDSTSRRPSLQSEVSALNDGTESIDDEASVKSGEDVPESVPRRNESVKKLSQPPQRAWHASCTLENEDGLSVVVVCGGISGLKEEGGLCEDLWSYDPESAQWSNHTPARKRKSKKAPTTVGRTPLPRAYHTLTRVGKGTEAVLFGGRTLLGDTSKDIFVLNSLNWTWSQLATAAPPLSPQKSQDSLSLDSVGGNSLTSFDVGTARSFVPCPGPPDTAWHVASAVMMPVEMLEFGYSEEEVDRISFFDANDSDDDHDDNNSHQPSVGGNSVKSNAVESLKTPLKPKKLWRQAKGSEASKVEVLLIFGGIAGTPSLDFNDNASVTSASSSIAPSTVAPPTPGAPLYALDRQHRWHVIETLDCRKETGLPNPVKGGPSARSGSILVASEDKDKVVLVGGSSCPVASDTAAVGGTGMAAALAMKSNRSVTSGGAKKIERYGDAMVLRLFAAPPSSSDAADDDLNAPVRSTSKSRKSSKKKGPQTVKLNLEDGGTYEGFVDAKGRKSGQGCRVYGPLGPDSGDVYKGEFEDDVREGEGTCTYSDGRVYTGNWSGDEPSGMGTMTYPNDNSTDCRAPIQYHGLWRRGIRHGSGVLTLKDGVELESNWRNGKLKPEPAKLTTFTQHPLTKEKIPFAVTTNITFDELEHVVGGTETYLNNVGGGQEEYRGKFNLKGERHSEHGVCVYADGSIYRGSWRNGRRNGRGTMEDSKTKELYDGKWVGGERLGKGLCTYPAGHRYDGTWAKGLRDGVGTFFKANGESYHGEFKAGMRHGYGVKTDSRGRVLKGWWKNDKLVEEDVQEEKPKVFDDDDLTSLGAPSVSSLVSYDFNADVAIAIE